MTLWNTARAFPAQSVCTIGDGAFRESASLCIPMVNDDQWWGTIVRALQVDTADTIPRASFHPLPPPLYDSVDVRAICIGWISCRRDSRPFYLRIEHNYIAWDEPPRVIIEWRSAGSHNNEPASATPSSPRHQRPPASGATARQWRQKQHQSAVMSMMPVAGWLSPFGTHRTCLLRPRARARARSC